jgi:hypothetical protein
MSANGHLSPQELAPIAQGQLAIAAAAAWNAMNVEARALGVELLPNGSKSSYRTYEQQVELYRLFQSGAGSLAAVPGQSNHGWGLAVDCATQQMRATIDRIGEKYGWSKRTSDAPSEWWHLRWNASWTGPDPGPYGQQTPIPEPPEDTVALALGTMPDGRFEVFVEDKKGNIWHTWQAKEGGWAGAEPGKRNAGWYSLGTPGGK